MSVLVDLIEQNLEEERGRGGRDREAGGGLNRAWRVHSLAHPSIQSVHSTLGFDSKFLGTLCQFQRPPYKQRRGSGCFHGAGLGIAREPILRWLVFQPVSRGTKTRWKSTGDL